MQPNQQVSRSLERPHPLASSSVVFGKSKHSRIYESFHLSNLSQNRPYDSQYRSGYPKLYSYDLSAPDNLPDNNSKYSFRNDNSRVVERANDLERENQFLRSEVSRLSQLLESQKRSSVSQKEIERLNSIIQSKVTEINRLEQRIIVLERQGSQPGEWQHRYNESQNVVGQLNGQIRSLNARLEQYSAQHSQLQVQISQYTSRISQLERSLAQASQSQAPREDPNLRIELNDLRARVSQYESRISTYESRISTYESRISKYQSESAQFESKISTLESANWKLENQLSTIGASKPAPAADNSYEISQLRQTISQYEQQITSLQQSNWKLEQRVTESSNTRTQNSNPDWTVQEGKLTLRVIILLEEINRLNIRERELLEKSNELHSYLLKAENYIEEVQAELEKNNLKQNVPVHIVEKLTRLEQENSEYALLVEQLNGRLSSQGTGAQSGSPDRANVAKIGERDLRIIILLEEINRLNQKTLEIRDYLARAEDYIEQLQSSMQQQVSVVPPEVENQINILQQENYRLNVIVENYVAEINSLKVSITQLETRPTQSGSAQVEYRTSPEIEAKIAFLAQENERLSRQIETYRNQPARVEYKTEYKTEVREVVPRELEDRLRTLTQENEKLSLELRSRPLQQSSSSSQNTDISEQTAKLFLQRIILLEEINRLNQVNSQTLEYLTNAENYIEQCETRINEISRTTQAQSVQEVVKEVFRVPPEVESRIALLTQENERLKASIQEVQNRPSRVETKVEHKVEYKIPPEIEAKIAFLAQENERLKSVQGASSGHSDSELQVRYGELQLRSMILLEEINRLNFVSSELRDHLMRAEDYIFEIENRPQGGQMTPEVQSQIAHLTEENQRLTLSINSLTVNYEQQISSYKQEISNYLTQINNYKVEVNNYHTQINEYRTQIDAINSQTVGSGSTSHEIQARLALLASENARLTGLLERRENTDSIVLKAGMDWGKERLKTMILLEEINRLNHKLTALDAERVEVINHLMNAENYIQEIEAKHSQFEFNSESVATNARTVHSQGQLGEQELDLRVKVAQRDLRVIFLLEEINRLNHKEAALSGQLSVGDSGFGGSGELIELRQEKQRIEAELQEVIDHLRRAEEYIQEVGSSREQLEQERNYLVDELNRLQSRT